MTGGRNGEREAPDAIADKAHFLTSVIAALEGTYNVERRSCGAAIFVRGIVPWECNAATFDKGAVKLPGFIAA
jgi:hypothetical protein